MGTVAGSMELREGVAACSTVCASALEFAGRWAIPSSMKRLVRCPFGSWPAVLDVWKDTVDDVVDPGGMVACRCPRFLVKVAEDMRCRGRTARGVVTGASIIDGCLAPSVGLTDEAVDSVGLEQS